MGYTRLTLLEREEISLGLQAGKNPTAIAQELGRSTSTITREINRFMLELRRDDDQPHEPRTFYRGVVAQHQANNRRAARTPRRRRLVGALWDKVVTFLREDWSPQQISAHLRKEHPLDTDMHVSHETIYLHLYLMVRGSLRTELLGHLRRKKRLSRSERTSPTRHGPVANMTMIEDRPAEVNNREVPGHWEADLIVGKDNRSCLGVMLERVSRACLLVPLQNKTATHVREGFTTAITALPEQVRRTLTYDQGSEMAQHQTFSADTGVQVFFCHPHSPWEKGGVENLNGLIRQYFPKGTDFGAVTPDQIRDAQDRLNGRPRRVLGWDTPAQRLQMILEGGVALEG